MECVGQGVGQVLDMSPVLQVQWALGWMLVEAFKQFLGVGVEMYRDVSSRPNEELFGELEMMSSCHHALPDTGLCRGDGETQKRLRASISGQRHCQALET